MLGERDAFRSRVERLRKRQSDGGRYAADCAGQVLSSQPTPPAWYRDRSVRAMVLGHERRCQLTSSDAAGTFVQSPHVRRAAPPRPEGSAHAISAACSPPHWITTSVPSINGPDRRTGVTVGWHRGSHSQSADIREPIRRDFIPGAADGGLLEIRYLFFRYLVATAQRGPT